MPALPASNHYGWVADLPDHRDHVYAAPQKVVSQLPPTADLRKQCPAVFDQGQIGSCTANAIAAAVQFTRRLEKHKPDFTPSRLFIYWNERNVEHSVPIDNGAQIRDGIKVVNKLGGVRKPTGPTTTRRRIRRRIFGRATPSPRSARRPRVLPPR